MRKVHPTFVHSTFPVMIPHWYLSQVSDTPSHPEVMAPPSEVPEPALFLAISTKILTNISTEIRHTIYRLSKPRFNITASIEKE